MSDQIIQTIQALNEKSEANHKEIMAVLRGSHDQHGSWHPGIAPRFEALEDRVEVLEGARASAAQYQLTWKTAIGLSVVGAALSKGLDFLIKLGTTPPTIAPH